MAQIDSILDVKIKSFLDLIHGFSDMSRHNPINNNNEVFPIFFDNPEYNQQSFFLELIEHLIWRHLVNGVFIEMFSKEYCDINGIQIEWIKMQPQIINSHTEEIEKIYPVEFVISFNNKRIGYRYTNCYWSEETANNVFQNYHLDYLKIINFVSKDAYTDSVIYIPVVPNQYSHKISSISLYDFYLEFFSRDDYEHYTNKVRTAIADAYKYMGWQTIPNMTLQYYAYFIKSELNNIHSSLFRKEEYTIINAKKIFGKLKESISCSKDRISEQDYNNMDDAFFRQGRYLAMCGAKSFAQSFLTSEYLYQITRTNNHIDYTSVVTGYLKSIEQLLYHTTLFMLYHKTDKELFIKCNSKDRPFHLEEERMEHSGKIRFIPENIEYFDTSFNQLINLLNADSNGWNVSMHAKRVIIKYLRVFCAECRNDHFHKDNISINDIDEVHAIRHNTLLLFYYVLGAYKYSEDEKTNWNILGIKDRKFDDMYQAIMKKSWGGDYFILHFGDASPLLVALPLNHGTINYNEEGLIENPKLRFVKLQRFLTDDWHKDDWKKIEEDIPSDDNLYITPDNMPTSIRYIDKLTGEQTVVTW